MMMMMTITKTQELRARQVMDLPLDLVCRGGAFEIWKDGYLLFFLLVPCITNLCYLQHSTRGLFFLLATVPSLSSSKNGRSREKGSGCDDLLATEKKKKT